MSRPVRDVAVVVVALALGGIALFVPQRLRRGELGASGGASVVKRVSSATPQDRAAGRRQALPGPLRHPRWTRRADRPGGRHRRRGPGLRHVAGGRHRRLAALRHDLGVDPEQSSPPRRADLVPVARRSRGGSAGGLRRRPRRQPRAARRRLPLPPPGPAHSRRSSWANAIMQVEVGLGPGHPGADGRSVGDHPAGHVEPQLLLARQLTRRCAPPPATAAGAAWRRARARSRAN